MLESPKRIGVVIVLGVAIVLAIALGRSDPELSAANEIAGRATNAIPLAAEGTAAIERRAVLPDNISEALDEVGLAAGRGTLHVRGVHVYDDVPAAAMNLTLRDVSSPMSRDPRGEFATRTDARGEATFSSVPAGGYLLDNDRDDRAVEVTIHAGRTTTVRFDVTRGVRVHGRTVDSNGRPIAGVSIGLSRDDGQSPIEIGTTAIDGTYRVMDLPMNARLSVHARDYCAVPTVKLGSQTPGTAVDFVMERGAAVVGGFVTGPGGAPISGATVRIVVNEHGDLDVVAHTDATGRFEAGGIRPGEHTWRAVASGFAPSEGTCTTRTDSTTPLHIALMPAQPGSELLLPDFSWRDMNRRRPSSQFR